MLQPWPRVAFASPFAARRRSSSQRLLAGKTGDAKAIEAELAANLIPNARMVPAGVVGVQRAQKAGFAYTFAG
jgi:hypothetical protein